MGNARDKHAVQLTEAALDEAGLSAWQSERREEEDLPFAEALADAGKDQAGAVLSSFLRFCLPPKTYGDVRRFKSGYYRMVALVWRLSPEMLEPCRTDLDVSRRLGISAAAFSKHLAKVDSLLANPRRK